MWQGERDSTCTSSCSFSPVETTAFDQVEEAAGFEILNATRADLRNGCFYLNSEYLEPQPEMDAKLNAKVWDLLLGMALSHLPEAAKELQYNSSGAPAGSSRVYEETRVAGTSQAGPFCCSGYVGPGSSVADL